MFRIAVMVEDRKLADVLRAVAGQVHNLEVVPVVIGDDTVKVDITRAPTLRRMTRAQPLTTKAKSTRRDISPKAFGLKRGDTFTYADLVPLVIKAGMSKRSTWYCTMRMLQDHTVRRIATGQYEVA